MKNPVLTILGVIVLTLICVGIGIGLLLRSGVATVSNPFTDAPSNYIEKQEPKDLEVNSSNPNDTATEVPATTGDEISVCDREAVQLGFWAVDDMPETFEIDSRGSVTHLQLWLPGVTPDDVEISVILKDVKIKVHDGGGTAWQWEKCMDESAARADAIASGLRRADAGKTTYQMTIEQINEEYPGTIEILEP